MSSIGDVYVSLGGQVLYITPDVVDNSSSILGLISENPTIGTKENPIPLQLDVSQEDVDTIKTWFAGSYRRIDNRLVSIIRFINYIGSDVNLGAMKHVVFKHLREGDFQMYSDLFDIIINTVEIFYLSERDIRAILLNPIYFFSDHINIWGNLRTNRGTVQQKKECLLKNYALTHQDVSLMRNLFSSPEVVVPDISNYNLTIKEASRMDLGIPDLHNENIYVYMISGIQKTTKGYTFEIGYGDKPSESKLDVDEVDGKYFPFQSASGNTLNIVDNNIGDILHIRLHRDKAPNVMAVYNMSVYDMTDSVRNSSEIPESMLDSYVNTSDTRNVPKPNAKGIWLR